jgi:hypothetical protein
MLWQQLKYEKCGRRPESDHLAKFNPTEPEVKKEKERDTDE